MFTGFEGQGDGAAIGLDQVRVDLGLEVAGEFGLAGPWCQPSERTPGAAVARALLRNAKPSEGSVEREPDPPSDEDPAVQSSI